MIGKSRCCVSAASDVNVSKAGDRNSLCGLWYSIDFASRHSRIEMILKVSRAKGRVVQPATDKVLKIHLQRQGQLPQRNIIRIDHSSRTFSPDSAMTRDCNGRV